METAIDKYDPEPFIKKYGEQYRRLFEDSLAWLGNKEPKWQTNMDVNEFVEELVRSARKGKDDDD